ncbi:MAG: hypothetical protein A2Z21_05070 [Candidatus Fraserbacteria bacterium RBG_16_55_9]|uniref:Plasmid maintenance system killer protein n=1 Tax=Fraserbacteria sp. (strain RBG_16_55_9) TaxID=1817864 RepID=A0A1F5UNG3_FRAXR|nr:MAG: hypothetical protein A2Z21_05070 [Candidatus Fraserbacteria bacterium RBG_16_55_9]
MVTCLVAIRGFKDKGLRELFNHGRTGKIARSHYAKSLMILDFLNAMGDISDCYGRFEFHKLKGKRKGEYAMSISGNYRICFKWDGKDVYDLQYKDYH